MRFHCFQHVSFESPGLILDWIASRGHEIAFTRFFESAEAPAPGPYDALIIMGGSMSVKDEVQYPWLREEKRWIRGALRQNKKILGICLGAQLLAEAMGSRVYPCRQKEIGFYPVRVTDEGKSQAIFHAFPSGQTVFHWHGETFDLPEGAIRLFETDTCPNQGFIAGGLRLGLQFHLEVDRALVGSMVQHGMDELIPGPHIQQPEKIEKGCVHLETAHGLLFRLLDDFFKPVTP
jgi:GMP synthase-like glutamine amidotransferase